MERVDVSKDGSSGIRAGDSGPILAPPTRHAPDPGLQVDARGPAAQVANPTGRAVVPAALHPPARPTGRFFDRRCRDKTRASGAPKIPRTVGLGRNAGESYASKNRGVRRGVGTRVPCPISALPRGTPPAAPSAGFPVSQFHVFTHTNPRRSPLFVMALSPSASSHRHGLLGNY